MASGPVIDIYTQENAKNLANVHLYSDWFKGTLH